MSGGLGNQPGVRAKLIQETGQLKLNSVGSCGSPSVGRNPGAALITRSFPGVEGPRGFPRGLPGRVC